MRAVEPTSATVENIVAQISVTLSLPMKSSAMEHAWPMPAVLAACSAILYADPVTLSQHPSGCLNTRGGRSSMSVVIRHISRDSRPRHVDVRYPSHVRARLDCVLATIVNGTAASLCAGRQG